MVIRGVVREWHADEGWGVLDAAETPGGCWAHFSALRARGYRSAVSGQVVTFEFEQVWQDGYDYRATRVELDAVEPIDPAAEGEGSA